MRDGHSQRLYCLMIIPSRTFISQQCPRPKSALLLPSLTLHSNFCCGGCIERTIPYNIIRFFFLPYEDNSIARGKSSYDDGRDWRSTQFAGPCHNFIRRGLWERKREGCLLGIRHAFWNSSGPIREETGWGLTAIQMALRKNRKKSTEKSSENKTYRGKPMTGHWAVIFIFFSHSPYQFFHSNTPRFFKWRHIKNYFFLSLFLHIARAKNSCDILPPRKFVFSAE